MSERNTLNKKTLKNRKKLLLDFISNKEYQPMRAKEIGVLLQIPKGKRADLYEVLDALQDDGMIKVTKGKYEKVRKAEVKAEGETLVGTFIAHPKGFGFVEIEGEDEDLYIHEEDTLYAFHQDQVEVKIKAEQKGARREGKIVNILSHGITEVVGTFEKNQNFGFVTPDNAKIIRDLFIPREHTMDAQNKDKVVAKIVSYGGKNKNPEGRIKEILGGKGQPGVDVLSIARSYELPMEFPERVINQSEKIPDTIQKTDFQGRMDIRNWTIVTIDGEDAKDLDDGISLTREGDIYHLGVHIADVSNYVQTNSALDREALKRGTSVYLVDRVIPMLPKRLSNGICSLNQGEDRLALSCMMDIDVNGNILDHKIAETVICVDRRMTYTAVKGILEDDAELKSEYKELVPLFFNMRDLSSILRKKRTKRGSIDFDFPESKIYLDEMGHPIDIKAYDQNVATRIIEDFMLLANETVAKEYCERELPFLYRTHENPDMDRMEKVLTFIRNQNINVTKSHEEITPLEVQEILASIEGEPTEPLISRLLLRSMKQAKYTTGCSGHFGLAAKHYCHFTSPIRRYPDLQIHRIIKDTIRGRMKDEKKMYYAQILEDVATKTSMLERRAEEVERETIKLKKAEYMELRIGQTFEGVISGVTGWGLYVELPNTVEGLVHVSIMHDDYYNFDEENYQMVGEASKKTYHLGDSVTVVVAEADITTKTVDFILKEDKTPASTSGE
ncbi:MAG: ribonuclease R [Clostridia bacterium]|nr:ribonuclease R [Clostridia bacterium]